MMLEVLDHTVRQLERGEASALEIIDTLFAEELTLRENRRVKMALRMAKLSIIKTPAGFDFSFQPSLDRNRVLALAQLDFIDGNEVSTCSAHPARARVTSRLVNARYERGAMILTSNRGFAEWGEVFGDPVVATALLDRSIGCFTTP